MKTLSDITKTRERLEIEGARERKLYNLIVTAQERAWEGTRYSIDLSRLGEYTATALVERLGLPAKPDINELMALPTLFAYEHFRESPARVGRVTRIRHSGNRVPFEFELDATIAPISHERIAELEWELDITKWEMNRTHWAVKDVDLMEALAEAGLVRHGGGLLVPAAPAGASMRVAEVLSGLDAAYVTEQWESAVSRIEADPAGAITLARSLLESVLKHLLEEVGGDISRHESLPGLYKAVAKRLKLAPDQQSEPDFRRLMGGAATVVDATAAIRNRFGDSHGRGRVDARAEARHAELVVHLAGGIASFLLRAWEEGRTSGSEKT